jgi:hypothetical protein
MEISQKLSYARRAYVVVQPLLVCLRMSSLPWVAKSALLTKNHDAVVLFVHFGEHFFWSWLGISLAG